MISLDPPTHPLAPTHANTQIPTLTVSGTCDFDFWGNESQNHHKTFRPNGPSVYSVQQIPAFECFPTGQNGLVFLMLIFHQMINLFMRISTFLNKMSRFKYQKFTYLRQPWKKGENYPPIIHNNGFLKFMKRGTFGTFHKPREGPYPTLPTSLRNTHHHCPWIVPLGRDATGIDDIYTLNNTQQV